MLSTAKSHYTTARWLLLFTTCLFFAAPALANQGDWVMVERFNKQLELAKQGNVKAMYEVGHMYERGRGTDKNLSTAAEWYEKAAGGGQASAKARLGIMYFEGRGVKKDLNKARDLIISAAQENIPSAQYQLANMFELGIGVERNVGKAIEWYQKASENGYYLAQEKVKELQSSSGTIARAAPAPSVSHTPAKKAPVASKPAPKSNIKAEVLLRALLSGNWNKGDKPVGYLPSTIGNCRQEDDLSMKCISTAQERSTGTEIITYNTVSKITAKSKREFAVDYTNNVLEVSLLEAENGDGDTVALSASRIKKGQQGKPHTMNCHINDIRSVTCEERGREFTLTNK